MNYKVDPDIHDFRLLHPVITLYSPAKANFVKVYFSVVSIEVSKMSENTGKSHENKMVIIDCGEYAYSALFDHGLASKSDQRFASIRSTGNLTFSTAF